MYLNKLEIFGFKSFANKTLFTFAPGITAVVGPNGCGKTNVVDAIRWVLGEQKTSILRSDLMENVIFNGTSSRKQLGMAEVSIILENTRKLLPVEYSEVTVTRRLFRDGESNYLINNTQCRLKDIVDLFMDTGMGANSYSVIELKMVEAILSGKPEERRHLIEEAAGINKYKLRRKETARKLAYVQSDLVRVNDLVSEVEKNVNSLARQASKTKKYKKLNLEQISLEKQLIAYDFHAANDDLKRQTTNFSELSDEKQKSYKEIEDYQSYLSGLETQFYKADEEWIEAVQNENTIKTQLAEINQDFAVSIERINSQQNNIERLKKEIENSEAQFIEYDRRLNENKDNQNQKIESIKEIFRNHADLLEQLKNSYDIVASNRLELNATNEMIVSLNNQILNINETKEKSESRKATIQSKIVEAGMEMDSIDLAISKLIKESEQLALDKDSQENELSQLTNKLNEYKSIKDRISNSIEAKKQELANIRVTIAKDNAAYDFLSKIVVADDASKFLIENANWLGGQRKPLLIEMLDADEEYRAAVQSALGQYANIFIVPTKSDVKNAIKLLKDGNKGKAYFVSMDSVPTVEQKIDGAKSGIIGYVSEIVKVEPEIRNLLRLLIGDVAVAETSDAAEDYVRNSRNGRAVTLSGEIYDHSGLIKGGSQLGKEGISVGKFQRIERITKELDELKAKLADGEKTLENLQKEYLSYNIEALQNQIKKKETDIYYIVSNITQKKYQVENFEEKKVNYQSNIKSFELELSGIGNDDIASNEKLGELEDKLSANKTLIIEINRNLTNSENLYQEKNNQVKELELEITRLQTELTGLEKENERIHTQIKTNEYRITSFRNEIQQANLQIDGLNKHIANLDTDKKSYGSQVEEAQTKREIIQQRKSELEQQIKQYEEDLALRRKNFEHLTEKVHQVDISINDLRTKLETIVERNLQLETEKIDLETYEIPQEFNPQTTKSEIEELKTKLRALGMINFMALEDYEKESERLAFYQKQVKDLNDSEKILQDTINEINQTAEQMFRDTFEKVRLHFQDLFKKLFTNEGESDLKLLGENVLECDIEIVAKPPGKKPHSIELLSGGEKTLTSIAFLFAIYLVKPSPFCILDEVDAPLDDANIDKFINMIRDFSENTQFLIVTHNKRTMESADTLYGITQQEEGISKIVSVKLQ